MAFEVYEYKRNEDDSITKIVIDTIDDALPSDASTPLEYLTRYINHKHIRLEKPYNEAVDEWFIHTATAIKYWKKVKRALEAKNLDPLDKTNIWKLADNGAVRTLVDVISSIYLLTYGDTVNFLTSDYLRTAPEEIRAKYYNLSRKDYYPWMAGMSDESAVHPLRPIIPEEEYNTFDKIEAKDIVVMIRNKFIRSNEDSIADALKLISFLAGAIRRVYEALPQESLDKMSVEDRKLLDYGFSLQSTLQTRCDSELAEEGIGFLKHLLTQEDTINQVILLVYNHLKA